MCYSKGFKGLNYLKNFIISRLFVKKIKLLFCIHQLIEAKDYEFLRQGFLERGSVIKYKDF